MRDDWNHVFGEAPRADYTQDLWVERLRDKCGNEVLRVGSLERRRAMDEAQHSPFGGMNKPLSGAGGEIPRETYTTDRVTVDYRPSPIERLRED